MSRISPPLTAILLTAAAGPVLLASTPASGAQAVGTAAASRAIDARPWPRGYSVDGVAIPRFQAQVAAWSGNQLSGRLAMSAQARANAA